MLRWSQIDVRKAVSSHPEGMFACSGVWSYKKERTSVFIFYPLRVIMLLVDLELSDKSTIFAELFFLFFFFVCVFVFNAFPL